MSVVVRGQREGVTGARTSSSSSDSDSGSTSCARVRMPVLFLRFPAAFAPPVSCIAFFGPPRLTPGSGVPRRLRPRISSMRSSASSTSLGGRCDDGVLGRSDNGSGVVGRWVCVDGRGEQWRIGCDVRAAAREAL